MAYRRYHPSYIGLLLGGNSHSPVYRMVISCFILLVGIFFFINWAGEKSAYNELKRTCISTADATIISVRTSSDNDTMSSAFVEYTTGGKKYTLYTPYTFDKKAIGGKVPIHYCPSDPKKAYSYDEPPKPDDSYLKYAAGAGSLALVFFTFAFLQHKNGVESGGLIGDSLKAKKNFESGAPHMPDESDLAKARMALSMPDYMHAESEMEMEREYPGRRYY